MTTPPLHIRSAPPLAQGRQFALVVGELLAAPEDNVGAVPLCPPAVCRKRHPLQIFCHSEHSEESFHHFCTICLLHKIQKGEHNERMHIFRFRQSS